MGHDIIIIIIIILFFLHLFTNYLTDNYVYGDLTNLLNNVNNLVWMLLLLYCILYIVILLPLIMSFLHSHVILFTFICLSVSVALYWLFNIGMLKMDMDKTKQTHLKIYFMLVDCLYFIVCSLL